MIFEGQMNLLNVNSTPPPNPSLLKRGNRIVSYSLAVHYVGLQSRLLINVLLNYV
jgi:hypothetical protein